jgi:hypothetical protein
MNAARGSRPKKPDDKAQSERFIETAHKVGADKVSNAAADTLMGQLARQSPEPRKRVIEKAKPGRVDRAERNNKEKRD